MEQVLSAAASAAQRLGEFDIILVGDRSASMEREDMNGRSRWAYMQETVLQIATVANRIDSDGVGLVLFGGSKIDVKDGLKSQEIEAAFAARGPGGGTPMAEALTAAIGLAGKSDKKDMIVVFTDGTPDDMAAVERVIREQANRQTNDDDLTILFIQVGHDAAATAYLKRLDDDLKGCKFDIVDAKTIEEVEEASSIPELLVAAISG